MRTVPDANTIAYLALGADAALRYARANGREPEIDSALDGVGENGFISDIVDNALMLDLIADELGNNFAGVFDYEVAEVFGMECADAALYGTPFDPQQRAFDLCVELTAA